MEGWVLKELLMLKMLMSWLMAHIYLDLNVKTGEK